MTASKFDSIVKARAQQRINDKVTAFRVAVVKAVAALIGDDRSILGYQNYYSDCDYEKVSKYEQVQDILKGLITSKWPPCLWEVEEAKVSRELLGIMDEMQKALIAADSVKATEFPEEPKETK